MVEQAVSFVCSAKGCVRATRDSCIYCNVCKPIATYMMHDGCVLSLSIKALLHQSPSALTERQSVSQHCKESLLLKDSSLVLFAINKKQRQANILCLDGNLPIPFIRNTQVTSLSSSPSRPPHGNHGCISLP